MNWLRRLLSQFLPHWPFILAASAAAFFLGGTLKAAGAFSAEMASWVQAIGSIVAVMVAIYVGKQQSLATMAVLERQLEDQRNRDMAALTALRESAVVLLVNARGRLVIALNVMKSNPPDTVDQMDALARTCEGVESILGAFPAYQLADAAAISWFVEARSVFQIVFHRIQIAASGRYSDSIVKAELPGIREQMIQTADNMQTRIDMYIDKFSLTKPRKVEISG